MQGTVSTNARFAAIEARLQNLAESLDGLEQAFYAGDYSDPADDSDLPSDEDGFDAVDEGNNTELYALAVRCTQMAALLREALHADLPSSLRVEGWAERVREVLR